MDKKELAKINSFTRRTFTEKELYTFPVVLCDNDIDRDNEAFSDAALEQMQRLFVGKTGIFDHDPKGENQSARIYDTEIITDPEKVTAFGAPYKYLRGKAYMVRTDENKSLIAEIDAGIKKEVSVSCSANSKICSICGAEQHNNACEHIKGREYSGKLCYHTLYDITDAYEWSFVAVPAQPRAGVTKKFDKEEKRMDKFEPITTQAALDEIVKAAIAEATGKFEGYISPEELTKQTEHFTAEIEQLKTQVAERDKSIADLTAQNDSYRLGAERTKAAVAHGIPLDLADRLAGTTPEELAADAEKLAQFVRLGQPAPMMSVDSVPSGGGAGNFDAQLINLSNALKGE